MAKHYVDSDEFEREFKARMRDKKIKIAGVDSMLLNDTGIEFNDAAFVKNEEFVDTVSDDGSLVFDDDDSVFGQ